MPRPRLLVATRNPGKMREYRQLLRDVPFELVSLQDLGITEEVEETGETFQENAWLKARAYAARSGTLILADDSGLEVDALGGEPGVRSARYGGDAYASDRDRVALLLRNLKGVPWERRTARFRCVIAIASPSLQPEILPGPPMADRGRYSPHPDPSAGSGQALGSASATPLPLGEEMGVRGGSDTIIIPHSQRGDSGDLASVVGSVAGMIQYEPEGDEGFGYDPVFHLPSYRRTMAQLPLEEKNRISHRADAARRAVAVLKRLAAAKPQPDN